MKTFNYLSKILGIILSILLTITTFTSVVVNAAEDPASVNREGVDTSVATGENFAKNLPFGTITIDTTNMYPQSAEVTFSGDNGVFAKNAEGEIVYAPNGVDSMDETLPAAEAGDKSGTDVPGTITLVWKGIATLHDGSTGDVTMTMTDVHFTDPKRRNTETSVYENRNILGPITIFNTDGYIGPRFSTNPAETGYGNKVLGLSMKINVQVTQDGQPVDGTVAFSTYDLDVSAGPFTPANGYENYRESFKILDGAVSKAYIPEANKLIIEADDPTSEVANGVKFTSTDGDNDTYNTGFAVLADNSTGITLQWWGAGRNMGTRLFTGNISHHIDSTTTPGGTIKTTTNGKVPRSEGAGDELGPITVDVPDGADASYLMEPDKGYKLDKILIDGQEIDVDKSSTWPNFIEVTKDAKGNPIVTFKENAADHTIHVSWEPKYKVKYDGNGGTGTMDDQEFTGKDEKMKTKSNKFERPGYTFEGFKVLDKDGEPILDDDGNEIIIIIEDSKDIKDLLVSLGDSKKTVGDAFAAEITLQAQWTPKEYKVSYRPGGGYGTMDDQHFTGEDDTMPSSINKYTNPGYRFISYRVYDKNGNPLKDENGKAIYVRSQKDLKDLLLIYDELVLEATWEKDEPSYIIPKTGIK